MEATYEFDVVDMPVTVAVDAGGTSAHITTGPKEWQARISRDVKGDQLENGRLAEDCQQLSTAI